MMILKYSLLTSVTYILLGVNCLRFKRLTNNTIAEDGEFPYMVSIQMYGVHHCGGAILSDRHVLTAAHCVCDEERKIYSPLTVQIGMTNLTKPNAGTKIHVDRVTYHPNYKITIYPFILSNDIAVIRLEKSISVSEFAKPIALPMPMQEYREDTQFIISGFGASKFQTASSVYLKKLTTFAVGSEYCEKIWNYRKIESGQLCVLSTLENGACHGDSGGPLTDARKVIVGVASEISNNGCGTRVPDVFTKVSHYLDFIRREMERTE